ncbi:TPA: hypothetical protein ACPUPA_001219 [Klebsiella pneumoniae]|uniref:hypothetical protein n=1 Tax=Klebsiella pneumoniae TaxID=573 RepID=UPI00263B9A00|nr:hypothetical protein [Klebsiella pneumoniae]MDN4909194.1 hypothetical protein [Klebsiella pneumoniae]
MGSLNKRYIPGLALLFIVLAVNPARAATTEITADIIDGICHISFSTTEIVFATKGSQQFATGTAEVQPLDVNLSCLGMSGLAPTFKVSGDSSGVSDQRLFRSASSTANYAGFMLKQGTVTDLGDFYNAPNTVAPGDVIAIDKDDGDSVQHFTVGLVHGAGDPPIGNGTVNAKINFAFVFP